MSVPTIERLHFPDGYAPRGGKVRALCHCGWMTTPRVDRKRARDALDVEHGYTGRGTIATTCAICGETVGAHSRDWHELRYPWEVFRPLVDEARGCEVYVCKDADACNARHRANEKADRLSCGCTRTMVSAVGHYHQDSSRARSCHVDEQLLRSLRENPTARRLWQARCDVCDWCSDEPFTDQAEAVAAAGRHHMREHSPTPAR